jgi:ferredoxin-NADP reductase
MKLKLLEKRDEARATKSFFWEPEKAVTYFPGQYFYFTLPKLTYPDPRGTTRHFTLSSSPTESSILRNTTRIREESGFKKTLSELPVGSVIEGEGPNGTFVLDEKETKPNIFIAGGIGITPFRSMIKYAFDKKLTTPIYLIYSNSDSDFAFGKELKEIDAASDTINVGFFDSSVSGHLDEVKIQKFIDGWKLKTENCTLWLCGPPPMIDAMEKALGTLKISIGSVRSEKFTGY